MGWYLIEEICRTHRVLHSILAGRVLLNLRSAGRKCEESTRNASSTLKFHREHSVSPELGESLAETTLQPRASGSGSSGSRTRRERERDRCRCTSPGDLCDKCLAELCGPSSYAMDAV